MALADALGNLSDFCLLPGQAHDLRGTAALIDGLTCGQFLADRAFDANWLREALEEARIEAVIPPKSNRRFPAEFDRETCKWRHLIENFFGKLKEYKGIAMRCCKTDIWAPRKIALILRPGYSGRRVSWLGGLAMAQMGFFDPSDRHASLDAKRDPLVEVDAVVPWEAFRPTLERFWRKPEAERKSRAGRNAKDSS